MTPSLERDEFGSREIRVAYKSYMDKGSQTIIKEVN
jgi:hypothetical protein